MVSTQSKIDLPPGFLAARPAPIVILGAGVIGLTSAVRLLESEPVRTRRIPVHILASHLPNDPLDAQYASTIAGAHHLSFADDADTRQARADRRSES
jgi:D-amino-acid oxidase